MSHSLGTFGRRSGVAALALALLIGVSACAPESDSAGELDGTAEIDTGTNTPGESDGQDDKKGADLSDGESSWAQPNNDIDVEQRTTELPASFPVAAFPIPAGSTIYDTGAPREGAWFVVLLASSETEAAALWDQIISAGGFTAADETATTEGGIAASLTNQSLRVLAVTLPQSDGTVQLSYDISSIG